MTFPWSSPAGTWRIFRNIFGLQFLFSQIISDRLTTIQENVSWLVNFRRSSWDHKCWSPPTSDRWNQPPGTDAPNPWQQLGLAERKSSCSKGTVESLNILEYISWAPKPELGGSKVTICAKLLWISQFRSIQFSRTCHWSDLFNFPPLSFSQYLAVEDPLSSAWHSNSKSLQVPAYLAPGRTTSPRRQGLKRSEFKLVMSPAFWASGMLGLAIDLSHTKDPLKFGVKVTECSDNPLKLFSSKAWLWICPSVVSVKTPNPSKSNVYHHIIRH